MTKDSYNDMAGEFSASRARFWEELAYLAEHATPGMRVLDIGCGNGRFYPLLKERSVDYVGLDNSRGLLEEARKSHPEVLFEEGDATALPFPNKSIDIAFSFATIHHIPGKRRRGYSSRVRNLFSQHGMSVGQKNIHHISFATSSNPSLHFLHSSGVMSSSRLDKTKRSAMCTAFAFANFACSFCKMDSLLLTLTSRNVLVEK